MADNSKIRKEEKNQDPLIVEILVRYQRGVIILVAVALLCSYFFQRSFHNIPLFRNGESYYYLNMFPFHLVPQHFFAVVPPIVGGLTLLLFFSLGKKLRWDGKFTFFFTLLLVISPTFLSTYTSLSGYAIAVLLVLMGLALFLRPSISRYFSLLPFLLTAFFDVWSSFLVLCVLGALFLYVKQAAHEKSSRIFLAIVMVFVVIITLANVIFKDMPFFSGPFHLSSLLPDLISDLGGWSGISFFVFILALIGITVIWTTRNKFISYLFLLLLIPAYLLSTQTVFYLTLGLVFFATHGFIHLYKREWSTQFLKDITIWILILSILFSTVTFFQRTALSSPSIDDLEALVWIKEYSNKDEVIFSSPENGLLIRYYAQRTPFYSLEEDDPGRLENAKTVLNSTYTSTTFPLLDERDVSIIYITPPMKKDFPSDQGLLFLLKNERFKLLFEREGYEVWLYK